jgi:protein tyrosine/serine phosphatase
MNRRRTIAVVMTAALAAAAVGGSQYWVLRGRVAAVEPGRLYRSALLSTDRLLDVCRRHGITTVVDFRKEPEEARAEADVLARAGIRHVNLPTGQVPSAETVAQFLRLMDAKRGEPVLIHCRHGVGRTGVFSAIYRMEYQGWPRWLAITEAVAFSGFDSFGPGNSKAEFLSHYTPRRSGRKP